MSPQSRVKNPVQNISSVRRITLGSVTFKIVVFRTFLLLWGSSGFAEQRNLKKIRHGIRNFNNFLGNEGILRPYRTRIISRMISRMRYFYEILQICGSFICCQIEKGRGSISVFLVSFMRIIFKLRTRILTATLLLFPPGWMKSSVPSLITKWRDAELWLKMIRTADLTENRVEGRISTPLMTPTVFGGRELAKIHIPAELSAHFN